MTQTTPTKFARIAVVSSFIALSIGACSYRQDKGSDAAARASTPATVSFAQVRDQVFTPMCVSCHSKFTDYGKTFADRDAIKKWVFTDHMMPKIGSLTADQASMLQKWLDSGAPEGQATSTTIAPEFPSPTWTNIQTHFFGCYCTTCHSPTGEADTDFTDVAQVRANIDDIRTRVFLSPDDDNVMPPSYAKEKIENDDKALLLLWIQYGMPGPDGSVVHPTPSPTAPAPVSSPTPVVSPDPEASPSPSVTPSPSSVAQ